MSKNPRGQARPHTGAGGGVGRKGGQRGGKNIKPCPGAGPGYGKGKGQGAGKNR